MLNNRLNNENEPIPEWQPENIDPLEEALQPTQLHSKKRRAKPKSLFQRLTVRS